MMRHSDQESWSGRTIRLSGGDCTASRNMQSQIAGHEQWPVPLATDGRRRAAGKKSGTGPGARDNGDYRDGDDWNGIWTRDGGAG